MFGTGPFFVCDTRIRLSINIGHWQSRNPDALGSVVRSTFYISVFTEDHGINQPMVGGPTLAVRTMVAWEAAVLPFEIIGASQ